MLVCNVSMRPPRRAIAAELEETATAVDATATGNIVFATLVDDPASVSDTVNAYLGEIMLEAASAADAVDSGLAYSATIDEAVTAAETPDATITPAPSATTWNPADKGANVVLSGGNLTISSTTAVNGVRGTTSKTTGKLYYEMVWNGSSFGLLTSNGCGFATGAASLTAGNPAGSVHMRLSNGEIIINGSASGVILGTVATGNVICVAMDFGAQNIWFRKNAGIWNNNASADPATNVGGASISVLTSPLFPYAACSNGVTGATANFGATAFAQTIPSGFSAWT